MGTIGVRLPDETYDYTVSDIVDIAQFAEDQGYHSVWAAELQGPNAFMTLGQIASETSEIGVGTGIVNVYSRTPSLIAMSVATLDEISDGRTFLGLAASSEETIENWHGVAYDQPLRRVRETIEIVNQAIANERVDYDGDIFTVKDTPRTYETVRDNIPVFNAALGPGNRKLTGEFADGWLPIHVPRGRFKEYIGDIEAGSEKADRDSDAVTIAPYIVACVDEDWERARGYARNLIAFYAGAMDYYSYVFGEIGFEDEVDAIRDAWSARDQEKAADQVTDELLDEVAIGGTPAEGREKLREYRDLGVDIPIVYPPPAPREVIETTLEELASY